MEEREMSVRSGGEEEATQPAQSMSDLLEEGLDRLLPKRGEIIEGIIVRKEPDEIIVDIGGKSEGVVSARDLERLDPAYAKSLKAGDTILVCVLRPEGRDGNAVLSISRARQEDDWRLAAKLQETGEVFDGKVDSANRGGLIVHIGRLRGFVPASQVSSVQLGRDLDDDARQAALSQLEGKTLKLKVTEMDRRRNRLILSERVAVREWRQSQKERLLDDLKEGETRKGLVSSLCDFGAFVDLGGADGLVHLSELAWGRVSHPREVLHVGQEVDVFVLSVDHERRRIALSIKRIKPEPWSTVEARYEVGQLVKGVITKVTDFGAFARLDEDIEGLIHISELSDERINHPSAVVHEGQEVQLRIIRLDPARQRLGLSLRRVGDDASFEDYQLQNNDQLVKVEDSEEEDR
ncbi:MAG: S1 RNA-binding domain-containing protein [Chloroflexota bacterium]